MKPKLLKMQSPEIESFSARRDLSPTVNSIWHYHEELELIYFKKGDGTQFVGDTISRFKGGDIVLIGSNLPHYWRFDQDYFESEHKYADVYVIHFTSNFLGNRFLNVPETREFKRLVSKADRGLRIEINDMDYLIHMITTAIETIGNKRLLLLLEILFEISSASSSLSPIATLGFKYNYLSEEQDQVRNIYTYVLNHYRNKISLKEISEVANVSPNTFCKFFKSRSKRNFTDFVNEIRVGQACKLLIENKLRVNEVCFESGFNNFASFHKCFRKVTGMSPLNYKKSFN